MLTFNRVVVYFEFMIKINIGLTKWLALLIILLFIITVILILIYNEGKPIMRQEEPLPKFEDISVSELNNIFNKKIFFSHHSVGANIIDGVYDILNDNSKLKLSITEYNDLSDCENSNLIHARLGMNTNPISKIDAFKNEMDNGIANKVDFAFLKLCFIDFDSTSNVETTFNYYKTTMEELKIKYPDTTFIHTTVPIVSNKFDVLLILKNIIKRIIGRPLVSYKDNIKRTQFNELLRKTYNNKEPFFDLARIESTSIEGIRQYHKVDNQTYYSMISEYTDDGGHLNKTGRKIVAEQLLIFLAKLSK